MDPVLERHDIPPAIQRAPESPRGHGLTAALNGAVGRSAHPGPARCRPRSRAPTCPARRRERGRNRGRGRNGGVRRRRRSWRGTYPVGRGTTRSDGPGGMSAHPVGVGIGLTTTARLRGPATERHATHTFARDASEIARARRLAAATLRAWGVRVDQSAIVLLTSELMTNAIRHGEGVVRMVL